MNAEDYRLAALGDADAQVRVADYYDEYLRGEHDGPIDVSDETAKELILKSFGYFSSNTRLAGLNLQLEEIQSKIAEASCFKCKKFSSFVKLSSVICLLFNKEKINLSPISGLKISEISRHNEKRLAPGSCK